MNNQRQVTVLQASAITISTIVGVGVLALPLGAARAADAGAPLVTFLGMALAFVGLFFMTRLGMRFPNDSYIQYSEVIMGRWLGTIGNLVSIVFFGVLCSLVAREFGEVVVTAVLKKYAAGSDRTRDAASGSPLLTQEHHVFCLHPLILQPIYSRTRIADCRPFLKERQHHQRASGLGERPERDPNGDHYALHDVSGLLYYDDGHPRHVQTREGDAGKLLGNAGDGLAVYIDRYRNRRRVRCGRNEDTALADTRAGQGDLTARQCAGALGCSISCRMGYGRIYLLVLLLLLYHLFD